MTQRGWCIWMDTVHKSVYTPKSDCKPCSRMRAQRSYETCTNYNLMHTKQMVSSLLQTLPSLFLSNPIALVLRPISILSLLTQRPAYYLPPRSTRANCLPAAPHT
jgi:hypothetical protein